jgi:hypothetical protein
MYFILGSKGPSWRSYYPSCSVETVEFHSMWMRCRCQVRVRVRVRVSSRWTREKVIEGEREEETKPYPYPYPNLYPNPYPNPYPNLTLTLTLTLTRQILEDPSNFFVVELATPMSESSGTPPLVQIAACLFLGTCFTALEVTMKEMKITSQWT